MEICIGKNVKALRLKKGITQEKLAEYLNVSTQAVSKWERNDAQPDLGMIVGLASYFGVTTDEILGFNEHETERDIQAYLAEYRRMHASGLKIEVFELTCEAYKRFPNDFRVIENYMEALYYDPHYLEPPYGSERHKEEIRKLCDRVLNESTLDSARYSALSILGQYYCDEGNIEKAMEIANRFPDYIYTKGEELEGIYDFGTEEWAYHIQDNMRQLVDWMYVKIRKYTMHAHADTQTRICNLQKGIDLIKMIYDNGDFGFANYDLCEAHLFIAYEYVELQEYDKAFEYLDKGLSYGKAYDDAPLLSKHTSFLVNRLSFDKMKVFSGTTMTQVKRKLGEIENKLGTNKVSEMQEFKDVVEKYRPYALEMKL